MKNSYRRYDIIIIKSIINIKVRNKYQVLHETETLNQEEII